jgi:hypothetical protein
LDDCDSEVAKLREWAREASESIINVKDLSVILMENSLIEQAIENHKLMQIKTQNDRSAVSNTHLHKRSSQHLLDHIIDRAT